MNNRFELIAKTFQGVEEELATEIADLGGEDITIGRRMVSFWGDKELMYRTNFFCRTALRILKPIYRFEAGDTDQLYNKLREFDWKSILTEKSTFSIDSVVYSDVFKNSRFVTYRAKDAIMDYFVELNGENSKRPSVSVTNPDVSINLHIAQDSCTLSLDSSGESLHKRGYRVAQTEAPINEVLAAAMLLKAGWDGSKNLVDPMCGSGTILIEAAMIATNTAPGLYRKGYAFEKWPDFDAELLENIYNDDSQERDFEFKIYGADISPQVIEVARQNVKSAGMERYISLETKAVQRWEDEDAPENCMVVTNPPYGERLNPRDLEEIYQSLGSKLKHVFTGCSAWIISSSMEGFDKIGLKPSQKIPLMNGALECEFREYQIFDGKYKEYKKDVSEGRADKPQRREKREFARVAQGQKRGERGKRDERGGKERSFDKKREAKSYRFDDRKSVDAPKPKTSAKPERAKSFKPEKREQPVQTVEKRGERLRGDEFVSKFITFRKPTLSSTKSEEGKQFRKRKNKE